MFTLYAVSTFGWVLIGVAFLAIWIALAFWPARVARRKGHSFIGYFIFSLFFFPLALLTNRLPCSRPPRGGVLKPRLGQRLRVIREAPR